MTGFLRDWLVEAYPDPFRQVSDPTSAEDWRDLRERVCVRIRAALKAAAGRFTHADRGKIYGHDESYSPANILMGVDENGQTQATGEIFWIYPGSEWAVCEDGFWWTLAGE